MVGALTVWDPCWGRSWGACSSSSRRKACLCFWWSSSCLVPCSQPTPSTSCVRGGLPMRGRGMVTSQCLWRVVTCLGILLASSFLAAPAAAYKPEGEMRWALYVTISPAWFDPAQVAVAGGTPFWICYALHDALVKPMPDNPIAPSLAESWTVSADQRVNEFKLREGLQFHNGDAFTAGDVKFSFQRSKAGKVLKDRVRDVEVVGPARVRFHLHEPFPDFMAYYGTVLTR